MIKTRASCEGLGAKKDNSLASFYSSHSQNDIGGKIYSVSVDYNGMKTRFAKKTACNRRALNS